MKSNASNNNTTTKMYPRQQQPVFSTAYNMPIPIRNYDYDWSKLNLVPWNISKSDWNVTQESLGQSTERNDALQLDIWKKQWNDWNQKCQDVQKQMDALRKQRENNDTEELKQSYDNLLDTWTIYLTQEPDHLKNCDCAQCYKIKHNDL